MKFLMIALSASTSLAASTVGGVEDKHSWGIPPKFIQYRNFGLPLPKPFNSLGRSEKETQGRQFAKDYHLFEKREKKQIRSIKRSPLIRRA